eukprot:520429-Rhodomonas_salina.2
MWRFGNVISEQTKANRAHITALYGNTQAEVVAQANRQVQVSQRVSTCAAKSNVSSRTAATDCTWIEAVCD